MTADLITEVAALAAAVGCVAVVLMYAHAAIPLRTWIAGRDRLRLVSEALTCALCTTAWLSLAATLIYRPRLARMWWPTDLIVTWLAITTIAVLFTKPLKAALLGPVKPIDTAPREG